MVGDLVWASLGSSVLARFSHMSGVNYKSVECLCCRDGLDIAGVMGEVVMCLSWSSRLPWACSHDTGMVLCACVYAHKRWKEGRRKGIGLYKVSWGLGWAQASCLFCGVWLANRSQRQPKFKGWENRFYLLIRRGCELLKEYKYLEGTNTASLQHSKCC